jgi:hypothetical protein
VWPSGDTSTDIWVPSDVENSMTRVGVIGRPSRVSSPGRALAPPMSGARHRAITPKDAFISSVLTF